MTGAVARTLDAATLRVRSDVLALFGLALAAGVYFVIRPGGNWSEGDSGLMALALRAVIATGELAPKLEVVYGNGFGYQITSATIIAFTGVSVATLQQAIYPLVSAVLVLPILALYRELTGSVRTAGLATLILLVVPEHLFAMLRGSHERVDRALMMTALWLLVRSVRYRGDRQRTVIHMVLFALVSYGLIATNALFGMSFVAALVTAFLASLVARWLVPSVRSLAVESSRLLGVASVVGAAIVVLFIQLVYPPLGPSLGELGTIPERLWAIIFSGGLGVDSYAGVLGAWIDPRVYLALSAVDFVVLVGSALAWLAMGWAWWRRGETPRFGTWMLWLLYASITLQEVVSVVSDRTGALQGNLAYRAFALFATMAAPILAVTLARWQLRPWARAVAVAVIPVVAVLALVKATLDPVVANKWIFYTEPEAQGLTWAVARQGGTDIWIGPDDRLRAAHDMLAGDPRVASEWDEAEVAPATTVFLMSDVIRLHDARLDTSPPELGTKNLLYDNGTVQVYQSRPSP